MSFKAYEIYNEYESDKYKTSTERKVEKALEEAKKKGLSPIETTPDFQEAKEILGQDFLGPEALKSAFGIEMEEIPEIPLTKEELEKAKELNQQLILYADKANGKPLTGKKLFNLTGNKTSDGKKLFYDTDWYKNEDFFTKETPKAGWKLVSKETIPDSTSKNYLEQTETIVSYLQVKVFQDKPLPEEYQKAITEFNAKKEKLKKLLSSDWEKAAEELENLAITKLTRETPIETIYRLALNERENKKRLLSNYSWTSRSSYGELVIVGGFDSSGVGVSSSRPDDSIIGSVGVSFSRPA